MFVKSSSRYLSEKCGYTGLGSGHPVSSLNTITELKQYRESVPNPKYKQIISDEGNATTPLYAYSQSAKVEPGRINISYKDGTSGFDTYMGLSGKYALDVSSLNLNITTTMANEAKAKATAQVYKSISQFQSTFSGQVFTGELKEILNLIKNPFAASAKLTDDLLRTSSFHGLKQKSWYSNRVKLNRLGRNAQRNLTPIPKDAADLWLQYSFAISPLINDIKDLLTLATDIALKRMHETVRGYGESVKATSQFDGTSGSTAGVVAHRLITDTYQVQNIIRCGMTAKFLDTMRTENHSNPWIDSIDDFSNVLPTFWELLPFSFLVDYFVNVQDIIQSAVVSQSGIAYTSNSLIRTIERKSVSGYNPRVVRSDIIKSVTLAQPKTVVQSVRDVSRTGGLLGIPPVTFNLPGSNVRYANIAALLTKLL